MAVPQRQLDPHLVPGTDATYYFAEFITEQESDYLTRKVSPIITISQLLYIVLEVTFTLTSSTPSDCSVPQTEVEKPPKPQVNIIHYSDFLLLNCNS